MEIGKGDGAYLSKNSRSRFDFGYQTAIGMSILFLRRYFFPIRPDEFIQLRNLRS